MPAKKNGIPLSNGKAGKDPKTGKFVRGNKLGTGNPYADRVYQLKRAIIDSASPEQVVEAMGKLWDLTDAKDPKVAIKALSEWLNRVCGRPDQELRLDATIDTVELLGS